MTRLEVKDIGAVPKLQYDIPDDFSGVLCVRGDQGTGKTTTITALRALVGKKVRLNPREVDVGDGEVAAKNGSVTLGGRTVKVGGRTTASGDLEFSTIEDHFDIEDLISPPFDKRESREATRIKALISVAGKKPDITPFLEVVGGKAAMDDLLTPKEQDTDDLVELCGKIKRAIEKQAAVEETKLESAEANARTAEAAAKDVDLTKPHDAKELEAAVVAANNRRTQLMEQRSAYAKAEAAAAEARAKLAEAKPSMTLEEAAAATQQACERANAANETVRQIEAELKLAKEKVVAAEKAHFDAVAIEQAVKQAHAALAGWTEQVESFEKLPQPDDAAIVAADTACQQASEASETGAMIRMAKTKLAEAEKYRTQAVEHLKAATRLREQAAAVFGVLSKQIPEGPLYVAGGQLVIDTDDRKAEPFDQLSEGEKSKIAVQYAVNAVGDGGIVILPQQFWDGLSAASKAWVDAYSVEHGVITIAGEIADGPLRIEPFANAA